MMKKTRTREDKDEEDAGRGAWTMRKDEGRGQGIFLLLRRMQDNERWQGKDGKGG